MHLRMAFRFVSEEEDMAFEQARQFGLEGWRGSRGGGGRYTVGGAGIKP